MREVGESKYGVFVAMELVRGPTLREWLAAGRTEHEIIEAFIQAGSGLAAAHAMGLTHRDFKPDNAIIGEDGRLRVLDFGLARDAEGHEELTGAGTVENSSAERIDLTQTGTILGTPAYMAPEQFLCDPTDSRTDQFAYCVALWEALEGRRPFAFESFGALRDAVVNGRRSTPERISPRLRPILERGLSTNPDDRFGSMEALLEAIRPADIKNHRSLIAGLVLASMGVAAAVVLAGRSQNATTAGATCISATERIAEVWNPEVRARGASRFAHPTRTYVPATWDSIERQVDAWTGTWATDYSNFCARSEDPGSVAFQQIECTQTQLRWLQTYLEVLEREDPVAVASDFDGVLPFWHELAFCRDEQAVVSQPPPMNDPALEEVGWDIRRGLLSAQLTLSGERSGDLVVDAERLVARAEALGVDTIQAEAALLRGLVATVVGEGNADSRLEAAALRAAASRHDWAAADAIIERRMLAVRGGEPERAEALWREADAAIIRAGDPAKLRMKLLASDRSAFSHIDPASMERTENLVALAESTYGDPSPELAQALYSRQLAEVAQDAFDAARATRARGMDMLESILGPQHPGLLPFLGYEAYVELERGSAVDAIHAYERFIAAGRAARPEGSELVAFAQCQLASAQRRDWQLDAAREGLAASDSYLSELRGPDHFNTLRGPVARLATLRWDEGRPHEARGYADRIRSRGEGPSVDSRHTAALVTALVPVSEAEREAALAALRDFDTESAQPGWRGESALTFSQLPALRNAGRWEEVLAITETHATAPQAELPTRLDVVVGLERGLALAQLDRPAEARETLERVVPHLEYVGGTHRAALAEFELARLGYGDPASRPDSLQLARTAARHFEQLGPGRAKELEEVRRWIAAHPG
jgi:hypothetical protein